MTYEKDLQLASERIDGCDCRSRQHREPWRKWQKRAIVFQILIAAVSAIAGSALLLGAKEGSITAVVIGGLTIASAILTAASEAISPANTAEEHRRAAIRFSGLGVAFNTLVRTWRDDDAAHVEFQKLEEEHRRAIEVGPEPEQWQ